MLGYDKVAIDSLLIQLEQKGYLLANYKFTREEEGLKLLGVGGFSYVYEVYDIQKPDNKYALKVVGLMERTISSKRFIETNTLQRELSEQTNHILRILQYFQLRVELDEDGNILAANKYLDEIDESHNGLDKAYTFQFILSEKLESILIKDKFKKNYLYDDKLKNEAEVIRFAIQISHAIKTAHDRNVLHRDIKLENIFWDAKTDEYKLGDFGIARFVEGENAETVVYTDGYGAPEIERRLVDHYAVTADIYSFGITLYLLLNNLQFPSSEGYYVNLIQYSHDFVLPAPANSSENVAKIIRKMCSYRAEDRYQSVDDVLKAFLDLSPDVTSLTDELDDMETVTFRDDLDETQTSYFADEASGHLAGQHNNVSKADPESLSRNQRRNLYNQANKRYRLVLLASSVIEFLFVFIMIFVGEHGNIRLGALGSVVYFLLIARGFILLKKKRNILTELLLWLAIALQLVNPRLMDQCFFIVPALAISNSPELILGGCALLLLLAVVGNLLPSNIRDILYMVDIGVLPFLICMGITLLAGLVLRIVRNKKLKYDNQQEA